MEKEFDFDGIVPWGRTFDEYCAFFALTENGLSRQVPLLDIGAGPSSFIAEAAARGIPGTAIDPIFAASADHIRARFEQVLPAMVEGTKRASHRLVWSYYSSPEDLIFRRRTALDRFLADYDAGRKAGRYLPGELPALPIAADQYRLALCSHLLFLYSEELDEAFHIAALLELLRVASEVRVFPLLNIEGDPSPHLNPVMVALADAGFGCETASVPFEFQRGAREMLRAWRA